MVQLVYASRKGQRLVVEKLIETLVGGMRSLGNMKKAIVSFKILCVVTTLICCIGFQINNR